MGLWDTIDENAREIGSGVGWLFGADDHSAPHEAAEEAHTSHPEEEERGLWDSIGHTIGQVGRGVEQEGLMGLLDPAGMLDRQDAQEELAGRFNVVGEGEGGNDQNNVTQEQFQEIARQYSDIRMGRSDLQINTAGMEDDEAEQFRERTMADIGDLLQTEAGRDLIGELDEGALDDDGQTRRITRIESGGVDVNNATGGGDWDSAHQHKQGFVNYVPGENHLPDTINARSDVTLFHELVHAYHSTHGSWDHGTRDENGGGEVDDSEFQAAGLAEHADDRFTENRYRRDRMEIGERGSGMRTLGGSDADMALRDYYLHPPDEHADHAHAH